MIVVVMGPSGSGKTTIGSALARAVGCRFLDADTLHSSENIERMRNGRSLSDEQRAPWLAAIAHAIENAVIDGQSLVVACSALRRTYRTALRQADLAGGEMRFVYLKVTAAELRRRLVSRTDHFASASLLASQLETLEEPAADETDIVTVDAARPIDDIVKAIRRVTFRNTL